MRQPAERRVGNQAVVIGGSIAGLLAARVLADHFDQVTIIERDIYPAEPDFRKGVPQGRHLHVLLLRGLQILNQFFPGLEDELAAAGAPQTDLLGDTLIFTIAGQLPRFKSGVTTRFCSRYLLEWLIRRRLEQNSRIVFRDGCEVINLLANDTSSKIVGVELRFRQGASEAARERDRLGADLVVDASGRDSHAPEWLASLGYGRPRETVINSFLGYATRWYKRPEGFEHDWKGVNVGPHVPDKPRGAALFEVEGGRWVVTLAGIARHYPPIDAPGFLEFARSLTEPVIYEAINAAEPISPIYGYRRTENRWRHYEEMARWPENFLLMGDAMCAFNPVYGQGMSVSAMEALVLEKCLRELQRAQGRNFTGLGRRFQKRLKEVIDTPWLLATGEDFRWPETEGGKPGRVTRLMHQYIDQVIKLSTADRHTALVFVNVLQLTVGPAALFQPAILFPALGQFIRRK
ncbi:MAG: 2-polyprenyl-6-methoxyphenol hydroxylase-like oxidoreductase [Chloroflexi bacterium]|nr:2-polyprenyl-6-methoxyphenol hydroxylase-like oxidoreductase [Chloroflexota bacterium]